MVMAAASELMEKPRSVKVEQGGVRLADRRQGAGESCEAGEINPTQVHHSRQPIRQTPKRGFTRAAGGRRSFRRPRRDAPGMPTAGISGRGDGAIPAVGGGTFRRHACGHYRQARLVRPAFGEWI
jgi:hypothetical protein